MRLPPTVLEAAGVVSLRLGLSRWVPVPLALSKRLFAGLEADIRAPTPSVKAPLNGDGHKVRPGR
jgi:hypothetical protein